MIVSAIADPSVFGPATVVDELTAREVVAFLRGIIQNGVLLCDPSRQMVRDAMAQTDALGQQPGGTQKAQRISLLLLEIYKHHKKFIVSCEQSVWAATKPSNVIEQIVVLHRHLKSDAILASLNHHAMIRQALSAHPELIGPADTTISRYESTRLRIATPTKPLDEMTSAEVEEYIGRAVKYCPVVRFYDYRMVARAQRTTKFRDGIHFVIRIWQKWCVVGDPSSRVVELYTVGNSQTQGGFLTSADAKQRLDNDIVVPLKASSGCHAVGTAKDDTQRIFHARGFEAKKRAFTIDPGFDALGIAGPTRRCLLKADLAAEIHFEQCRNLRSV